MNIRNIAIAGVFSLCICGLSAQTRYTLADCEKMATENNYRIKNSKLDISAASQTRKEAFTNYFPMVNGMGGYFNANHGLLQTNLNPGSIISPEIAAALPPALLGAIPSTIPVSMMKNGTVAAVTATQPIFAGGRIVKGNKLAKVGEEASQLKLELTQDEVVLKTHTYFWQIVNLREKLSTITALEDMLSGLHKDVDMAVKTGLANRNDLLRVELKMQEVESGRLKVENGIRVSRMLLAQFVGADMGTFDIDYTPAGVGATGTTGSVSASEAESANRNAMGASYTKPESLYRDAFDAAGQRTEAKLLDQNVNAAKLRTKISGGERLPSMGVGGGYLYNDLLDKSNNAAVVYATVSIPISAWWGGSHARRHNKYMEQQAENEKANAIELMAVEISQTWNELVEAHKQILLAEKSIVSATENLRIVDNSYKAGTLPLTDLLDAQTLYRQSMNMHSDAYSDYQIKALRYKQITDN